jgi:hypothetical protein
LNGSQSFASVAVRLPSMLSAIAFDASLLTMSGADPASFLTVAAQPPSSTDNAIVAIVKRFMPVFPLSPLEIGFARRP